MCIDSPQGNTQGSLLYMSPCHSWDNQRWSNSLSMPSSETFFPIYSAYNQNYGFDIYGGSNGNQTAIKMWNLGNAQWNQSFEYNSDTQEIRNIYGKCIDTGNINSSSGYDRTLRINDCHGGSNQKFYTDNSYRIHSSANGNLCIDSQSGDAPNSLLYMGNCHTGNNQKWWLRGWLN